MQVPSRERGLRMPGSWLFCCWWREPSCLCFNVRPGRRVESPASSSSCWAQRKTGNHNLSLRPAFDFMFLPSDSSEKGTGATLWITQIKLKSSISRPSPGRTDLPLILKLRSWGFCNEPATGTFACSRDPGLWELCTLWNPGAKETQTASTSLHCCLASRWLLWSPLIWWD